MIAPEIPLNEAERLRDLFETELLDTPQESEFDDIVKLASQICNTPMSLITLIDANRQWFKAKIGFDIEETSREVSFCAHAILQDQLFEIPDTLKDKRFVGNPFTKGGEPVRYYAGFPLITSSGSRLGTLCVVDNVPRQLDQSQKFALEVLSRNVIKIAELRMKNKQLSHMAETHKKMTSILAHDVRNPMVSIRSIIDYKRSGLFSEEEYEEMMDIALEQLTGILQMVDDVVDWGQSQMKFYELKKEIVPLKEVVDNIFGYEVLKARIKNNEMINETGDINIFTDKQALTFIIRNLVSNANKYTESGSITVSASQKPGAVSISIEDTGTGMTDDKAASLFNNTSSSTSGTRNEKGNGLGLMLANEYIYKLNGSISVKSTVGSGTRFTISLNEPSNHN